jgi:hypothetical protein
LSELAEDGAEETGCELDEISGGCETHNATASVLSYEDVGLFDFAVVLAMFATVYLVVNAMVGCVDL